MRVRSLIIPQMLLAATLLQACTEKKHEDNPPPETAEVILPVNEQEVFCMSMISNLPASLCWLAKEEKAAENIIAQVKPMMDATLDFSSGSSNETSVSLKNWQRVWGPAVVTKESKFFILPVGLMQVPVSSMTIFKQKDADNYVVGIEATNPYSVFDWEVLDLKVGTTHQWYYDTEESGQVSTGTWEGINDYLLQLQDIDQGNTAVSFLNNVMTSSKNVNIVVTGHSLGGALSPVFALYMKHNADSINNNTNIYCLSTAGPTPGDSVFAQYYNSKLGQNTKRVWNTMDVVPRAWVTELLEEIKSDDKSDGLYSRPGNSIFFDSSYKCNGKRAKEPSAFTPLKTPGIINHAIQSYVDRSLKIDGKYTALCGGGTTFTGAKEDSIYINIVPSTYLNADTAESANFMAQLGNQHVAAYTLYYDIKDIHEFMRNQVHNNKYSVVNLQCRYNITGPTAPADATPDVWFLGMLYQYAWE